MFAPAYYTQRACELESEAKRVGNASIRASYLDLARAFREMANCAGHAQAEADGDAEGMVGKDFRHH